MADSEEDCDTWRNRDKYPKEREPSEKKASLSPVDQKTEKRPFNSFPSPNKSVEPPFKKQKSTYGDDSSFNNSGSFNNNRREGFENRRDNFDNRKDNFDNRKDSFENRKDSFDNRKDNFDNRKDSFDNRKDSFDNRKDSFDNRNSNFDNRNNKFDNRNSNFDNRKDSFDNRKDNFDNRKDNFDKGKDNFDSRREGFENRRESLDNRFPVNTVARSTEEAPNYPTQPQMLLFKHFLQQQDDDIEMEAAMVKYNEYKDSFVKKQLKAFFDAHNSQEWFREKYLPSFVEINKQNEVKNVALRKEVFTYLYERQWMDNIKLHVDESDSIIRLMDAVVILLEGGNDHDLKILDSRRYRSESPNDTRIMDTTMAEKIEGEEEKPVEKETELEALPEVEEKKVEESRALHKTFSIFLRNLHPNVLRSEIEALVKPYPGFLRLALQDPTPDRKFFRRGWVTYDRTVNIKEICWNLNNIRLHDCDIGAIVNRELTQRVRPVNVLTNHKPVMRQDLRLAAKLVAKFDKRHNLWQPEEGVPCNNPLASGNPLLKDITEYLVDEGSYEEEALLGGNLNCNLELTSSGADPANIVIENDDKLVFVLDKLVLYLRFMHSYDYYSNTEYQNEDEMPHRCGIIHARGAHIFPDRPLSLKDVEEYIKTIETKADAVLSTGDKLSVDEAKKLGFKDPAGVMEAFILANTQEIAKDKWLCPLSGKKFKGADFVRKHILNKHMEKVEEAVQLAHFFNNYLMDVKRPQLPEHPTNRIGAAKVDCDITGVSVGGVDNSGGRGRNDCDSRGGYSRGGGVRRGNYGGAGDRGSPPSGGREFGGRSNNFDSRGGNNGSYYQKNNFSGRGGQGRQRNGGGSYYSRNVMSYKDLDEPMDD